MGSKLEKFNFTNTDFFGKFKGLFLQNKYQATVVLLSVFIIFMLYSLLSDVIKTNKDMVYVTSQGITVDLTIDDIKKDMLVFQSMDPTGDEKSIKYQEILGKLNTLETKQRRLQDVAQLKRILQADYFKGFNIIAINNLAQFDDLSTGKKTRIFNINATEQQKL